MGLENRATGNYITILNGKFCKRVEEKTQGAIQRVNKLGKVVYELFFTSFTGKLVDIKTQDGSYGLSWVFDFIAEGEVYHLQLSYSNSFATAFLKMLPNIDLTKVMKLSPSVKEVDGKNKSSLFINQEGKTLKHFYTREVPNGLPSMEEVTVRGVKTWDDTKRLEFLHNMVVTEILPKLEKTEVAVAEEEKDDGSLDDLTDSMKSGKDGDEDAF